jgi:hypothetical protein
MALYYRQDLFPKIGFYGAYNCITLYKYYGAGFFIVVISIPAGLLSTVFELQTVAHAISFAPGQSVFFTVVVSGALPRKVPSRAKAYTVAVGPFLKANDGVNANVITTTPSVSNIKRNFFMMF